MRNSVSKIRILPYNMSSKKYSILYAIGLTFVFCFSSGITAFFEDCFLFDLFIFCNKRALLKTLLLNRTSFGFVIREYLKGFYFPDKYSHL